MKKIALILSILILSPAFASSQFGQYQYNRQMALGQQLQNQRIMAQRQQMMQNRRWEARIKRNQNYMYNQGIYGQRGTPYVNSPGGYSNMPRRTY